MNDGRLLATSAQWHQHTEVVIAGSGAAGLAAAVQLAAARVPTTLITRARLTDSSTDWAQGGLAAVWDDDDAPDLHVADTHTAGAGLCRPDVVAELVAQAPGALQRLIDLGAEFDRDTDGHDLHLEGGHQRRRILHAGDRSGAEVMRTLTDALARHLASADPVITVAQHLRALDVLTDASGAARGVRVLADDGTVGDLLAPAVVLATGGLGQLWRGTSNPTVATGDGIAMAWRAGATIRDLEFVQFHPTVLAAAEADGRGVLISEAVRGEGAVLVDQHGARVLAGVHPLADLAPRDVVSAAMHDHLQRTGEPHLYLDGTHLGAEWESHFPTILAMCRERGVDPVSEPIPVQPGAHYLCGGVAADLDGRTTVPGLYAVGEVAGTGVHGANRLASNSLPEALIAGHRVGTLLAMSRTEPVGVSEPAAPEPAVVLIAPQAVDEVRDAMTSGAGVLRTEAGLRRTADRLAALGDLATTDVLCPASVDATNMHTVASLVVAAALARTESRGAHRRLDHPEQDGAWTQHITLRRDRTGAPLIDTQSLNLPRSTETEAA